MSGSFDEVAEALAAQATTADAEFLPRFFKTGPGEYGEGDVFLGVRVPATRRVVAAFRGLPDADVDRLLDSPVHEHRLAGLLMMVDEYLRVSRVRGRDEARRRDLHGRYLAAVLRGRVNNWDLVDSSAEYLIGGYLLDTPAGPTAGTDLTLVDALVADPDLWRRRVGILATFAWTKAGLAAPALAAAASVLDDPRDLIHKASGWMLREAGNRADRAALIAFLDEHAAQMPRTMLSYATEHLSSEVRAHYRSLR